MGEHGVVRGTLTVDIRRSSDDAAADSARRARRPRPYRRRLEVLSRAQESREDGGVRHLSARQPRPLRADAGAGTDAQECRVVWTVDPLTLTLSPQAGRGNWEL